MCTPMLSGLGFFPIAWNTEEGTHSDRQVHKNNGSRDLKRVLETRRQRFKPSSSGWARASASVFGSLWLFCPRFCRFWCHRPPFCPQLIFRPTPRLNIWLDYSRTKPMFMFETYPVPQPRIKGKWRFKIMPTHWGRPPLKKRNLHH